MLYFNSEKLAFCSSLIVIVYIYHLVNIITYTYKSVNLQLPYFVKKLIDFTELPRCKMFFQRARSVNCAHARH